MGAGDNKLFGIIESARCSSEYDDKLSLLICGKEKDLSRKYLLNTFDKLNIFLGRDKEKEYNKITKAAERDTLSDLVAKVCEVAEMIGGMYVASEVSRNETKNKLNDALKQYRVEMSERETEKGLKASALEPARSDFHAAIDASFRIKIQEIIIKSLDRQLKNKSV